MVTLRRVVNVLLDVAIVVAILLVSISLLNDFDIALPVEGISMLPTIHTGDLAIVLPTTLQSLHVGDIVVYRYGTEMIIHRVVSTHFNAVVPYVTVKGDNNPFPDPAQVTQSALVGKVDALIYGFSYITSQTAKIGFALTLLALIILDYSVGGSSKQGGKTPSATPVETGSTV
jgi:signal peptidase I